MNPSESIYLYMSLLQLNDMPAPIRKGVLRSCVYNVLCVSRIVLFIIPLITVLLFSIRSVVVHVPRKRL